MEGLGPDRAKVGCEVVTVKVTKFLRKSASGGCIEAVISACCTADVIPANTGYRRQNQFAADLARSRGPPESPASTSVIEIRIDRQLQKSGLQRSKSGKGKHSRHWIRSISESILGPVPYIGKQDCVKRVLCRQFIEQSKGGGVRQV